MFECPTKPERFPKNYLERRSSSLDVKIDSLLSYDKKMCDGISILFIDEKQSGEKKQEVKIKI